MRKIAFKKVLLEGDAAVLSDTVPNTIEPDDSPSAGVATEASRRDHEHGIVAAVPGTIGENDTPAEGSAVSFSRSDHVHGSPVTWAPAAHLLGVHTTDTLANLNAKVTDATLDDSSDPRDPNTHASDHEDAGGDEISVAGLSGELADDQPPKTHAASHKSAGGDPILLHEFGDPIGGVQFNQQELLTPVLENLASAPGTPVEGQMYYNTGDDHPYVYVGA